MAPGSHDHLHKRWRLTKGIFWPSEGWSSLGRSARSSIRRKARTHLLLRSGRTGESLDVHSPRTTLCNTGWVRRLTSGVGREGVLRFTPGHKLEGGYPNDAPIDGWYS
jgi:hypothetical protein